MDNAPGFVRILPQPQDDEDFDFRRLLDDVLEARWFVLAVTALVMLVAGAYAFLSSPVYEANTLIQVEKNQGGNNTAFGEIAALFDLESPSSAEIEILRSRLVVAQAVDELRLFIEARPDYLPFVGPWLARRATRLSEPGFLGLDGYVTGTESISVKELALPDAFEGKALKLVATEGGYQLRDPDDKLLVEGQVNLPSSFEVDGQTARVWVERLDAKPGASFTVMLRSRLGRITDLQDRLQIEEKGKQSGVLALALEGTNPALTASIVNAIGSAYVRQNIERKSAEADKSLAFLDGFLPQLREQMQRSEEKYTTFRDTHGTFDLGAEGQASLDVSIALQTKLLELQQKRRQLETQFTAAHPAISVIEAQISALQSEIDGIARNVRKMPDLQQQLLSLMRDVEVNSQLYVSLLNSGQQLRLVKEGRVGNVRVVDAAVVPERAVKPQRALILGVGIALGLMLGISVALLRKWLRPGITDASEIEANLGMHVFATIPHSSAQTRMEEAANKRKGGRHILAEAEPHDPAVEGLRSLQTALHFAMLNAPNNIVLITGPTQGIGKSFTSLNFSTVMGAGSKRILLVDADMRKGRLHQYLGLKRDRGLSELLSGDLPAHEAIRQNVLPNVDLITTGVLPPNPAELLLGSSELQIIRELSVQYDLIVLDSAPVLSVSDSLALAPHVGTVLLLSKATVTTLGELEESSKRLRQAGASVKGVIFNDLTPSARRYSSKYGSYRYTNYEYGRSKS